MRGNRSKCLVEHASRFAFLRILQEYGSCAVVSDTETSGDRISAHRARSNPCGPRKTRLGVCVKGCFFFFLHLTTQPVQAQIALAQNFSFTFIVHCDDALTND